MYTQTFLLSLSQRVVSPLFGPGVRQHLRVIDPAVAEVPSLLGPSILEPHLHPAMRQSEAQGELLLGPSTRQRFTQEHFLENLHLVRVRALLLGVALVRVVVAVAGRLWTRYYDDEVLAFSVITFAAC